MNKSTLTFASGVGAVTGANFLLQDGDTNILIDCGLTQGGDFAEDENRIPFIYDPKKVQVLLLTHAHADHIGRVPKLIKEGFRGVIYSTIETKEISRIMLEDTLHIMSMEARNKHEEPIFGTEDIETAFSLWKEVPYHKTFELGGGYTATLKDAGHILGSAMVEIVRGGKKIVFTGDLGNTLPLILKPTEIIPDADYVVIESVYGDRIHENVKERKEQLKQAILDTAAKKGVLIIPAFSLERTQNIIHDLNEMVESGELHPIPVFIDSPLATKVTRIYKERTENLNETTKKTIRAGDDIYNFPRLTFTLSSEESRAIKEVPNPKVIIAGSGMSNGGRVIHHEINYLSYPTTTLLIVGYQAAGTLGRQIQDGAKEVTILGQTVRVHAKVQIITGYSAHADSDGLTAFVEHMKDKVESVFVVMGEPKASLYLAQHMRDYLGVHAVCPKKGDSVEIEL